MSGPTGPAYSAGTGSGSTTAGSTKASDQSIGSLLASISTDVSTLMRQEVALAKAEVRQEAVKAGGAVGMLGGAGFAGYLSILFVSIAVWQGLDAVMPSGWAALIVAVVWGIVATVLGLNGRKKMQRVNPKPEQTVQTLQQVPSALKPDPNNTTTEAVR
ncbi:MAG: phage holin family protein [Actinomycetota bacterium]|nr:phage holin family protein [Actinomycetota bacterium]